MRTILLSFTLFIAGLASAQNSNVIFFSEGGEKFFVIINGLRQNTTAQTNVKLNGITPNNYKVKVIFENAQLGDADKDIYVDMFKEYTYVIKKKSQSDLGKSTSKVGHNLKKNFLGNPSDTSQAPDKGSWYVIRAYSQVDLVQPEVNTTGQGGGTNTGTMNGGGQMSNGSTTNGSSTTTTTTTTNAPAPTGDQFSMNINLNVSESGGGINISGSDGTMNSSSSTTTTTTSSTTYSSSTTTTGTGSTSTSDHYVMNGYDGPVGCPWPMSPTDFESAKKSIQSKSFEDSKLTIAKQIINSNCLLCSQVKEVMLLFSFEQTRLDLAKYAYGRTFDQGNYYKLNDAFTFESSIDELNKYVEGKR